MKIILFYASLTVLANFQNSNYSLKAYQRVDYEFLYVYKKFESIKLRRMHVIRKRYVKCPKYKLPVILDR